MAEVAGEVFYCPTCGWEGAPDSDGYGNVTYHRVSADANLFANLNLYHRVYPRVQWDETPDLTEDQMIQIMHAAILRVHGAERGEIIAERVGKLLADGRQWRNQRMMVAQMERDAAGWRATRRQHAFQQHNPPRCAICGGATGEPQHLSPEKE